VRSLRSISPPQHQQAAADVGRPVMAHLEAASVEIQDIVCRTDQLAGQAQEEVDQELKEVAVEEDTASTLAFDSAGSLAASVNSEASHVTASSPEVTLGPEGRLTACSSFKPDLNVHPPLQAQPLASGSFKMGSDSKLSAFEPSGASVAATEARDADGAAAGHESAQAAAAPVDAISARIVGQSGKFYTIETLAADQQNRDLAPLQTLTRRYREFAALDKELRPRHQALPTLPQKSVFFRRTFKHGFMDDREQRLGAYLSAVVADPSVVAEPSVQMFLGMVS